MEARLVGLLEEHKLVLNKEFGRPGDVAGLTNGQKAAA